MKTTCGGSQSVLGGLWCAKWVGSTLKTLLALLGMLQSPKEHPKMS